MSALNSSNIRLAKLKRRRKIWLTVHLWLGLLFGVYLSVIGLTGSILAFHPEIDEWLEPELLTVQPPAKKTSFKPLAEILAASATAMASSAQQAFAVYPRNDQAAFTFRYALPINSDATEFWEVAVNPYTAEVLGKRLRWTTNRLMPNTFIDFIFTLHYTLFLGNNGELVVSIIGLLSIFSVLTGLIIWWPLTGKWRQAFTIKPKASYERLNYDLHKITGAYSLITILPVLFSGIYITEPKYVVPLVELFSPASYRYWFQSTPRTDLPSLTMADAVAIANQRYPNGRTHFIYGATQPSATFTVCKNDVKHADSLLRRRCVVLDRYSGKILDVDDPAIGTAGEIFSQWQWPVHSGQAFGITGRILVCFSGLICALLFATGVLRWKHKYIASSIKNGKKENTWLRDSNGTP